MVSAVSSWVSVTSPPTSYVSKQAFFKSSSISAHPFQAFIDILYERPGGLMHGCQTAFAGCPAAFWGISKPQYSFQMLLSYRRQQAQPQAISKNATKNKSAPTGKMAAIRIPAPSATAQMPKRQLPPPRNIPLRLLSLFQYSATGCPRCGKSPPARRGFCCVISFSPANPAGA